MAKSPLFSDHEITCAAAELTDRIAALCAGQPTASVYLAIANVLGNMEMHARRPDRDGLFNVIASGMDEFIRQNRPAFHA